MTWDTLVERLTRTHKVAIMRDDGSKVVATEDGLISQLREAICSSVGRTESGRSDSSSRSPMNLAAFELYERIKGEANDLWESVSGGRASDPDATETIVALWAAAVGPDAFIESDHRTSTQILEGWDRAATGLFDPPVTKEIVGACPECGERDHFGPEGERSSAVMAYYWRGVEPAAQCRRCRREWKGRTELIQLGYRIGAAVDEDALQELEAL